jgi:hypothetical protein
MENSERNTENTKQLLENRTFQHRQRQETNDAAVKRKASDQKIKSVENKQESKKNIEISDEKKIVSTRSNPNEIANVRKRDYAESNESNNLIEFSEQKRLNQAAEEIKKIDWMNPEKWKTLNPVEKRIALEHSGRALGKAYDHPEPPLSIKGMGDPNLQGTYGDGYSYRPESPYADKKGISGADYGIEMNQDGMDPSNHKKLFGENPGTAVETYAHEFRHSYQHEQANAFEKGFKTNDPAKAKEWSENFKNYQQPPDAELAKIDRENFIKQYEVYRNQPVERDANDFGAQLSSKIFDEN